MEPAISRHPPLSIRPATCLWCHEKTRHAEVIRNHGLCRSCAENDCEIAWRLVYDRDRRIGAIPANLRRAYSL